MFNRNMIQLRALLLCVVIVLAAQNGSAFEMTDVENAILNAGEAIENFLEPYNPNLPKNEVVQFYCANYTHKQFVRVYFDDPNIKTKVNVTNKFAFLIHGWTDTGNETWMIDVANTWIKYYDTNLCRVGWDVYASAGYITAATRNVKLVAAYAAQFIKSLNVTYGVSYASITIAGHSLGAHIAGGIGFNLRPSKIKRIIGMDPAGPLFTTPIKISTDYRLEKTDAQEVIIIHTTDGVLGLGIECGHQDFYPDKGLCVQPGCLINLYGTYGGGQNEAISCSHIRAVRIFHSSLVPGNKCTAKKCGGLVWYTLNICDGTIAQIGPYTKITAEGQFYMKSDGKGGCTGTY